MKSKITKNELLVLQICTEYLNFYGFFPSYREILKATKLSSIRSVFIIIHSLVKKGFLEETGVKRVPVRFPRKTKSLDTNGTTFQGSGTSPFNFI